MHRFTRLNFHDLLYVYLGLIIFPGSMAKTKSTSNCQEQSYTDRPKIYPKHAKIPHLSLDFSTNVPDSSLKDLKLFYENCKVRVEFECVANYPVEWVEHYEQVCLVLRS